VYRKCKASVEISSGGRVYTEDSGTVLLKNTFGFFTASSEKQFFKKFFLLDLNAECEYVWELKF
jgi:hypothetical protein